MKDFEIQEIRRIRSQISSEHGNEIHAIASYYRRIENELKKSGKYRFIEKENHFSKEQHPQQIC